MFQLLTDNNDVVKDLLFAVSLFLPRTLAFFLFFPVFSRGYTSYLLKYSVAVAVVAFPATAFMQGVGKLERLPYLSITTAFSELVLGTLLGLTMAFSWQAFKAFGALVEVYRGATFAAQVTPGGEGGEELPFENLMSLLFCALIFAGPGLLAVSKLLLDSFYAFPPGQIVFTDLNAWVQTLIQMCGEYLILSLLISGPVLIAILIAELVMEIVSAFSQQLQVYSIQFGVRGLFAIGAVFIFLSYTEEEIFRSFEYFNQSVSSLIGGLQ